MVPIESKRRFRPEVEDAAAESADHGKGINDVPELAAVSKPENLALWHELPQLYQTKPAAEVAFQPLPALASAIERVDHLL